MTTRTIRTKSSSIDWSQIKLKIFIIFLVTLSIVFGFVIGSVYSQKKFDQAAIQSGHAQFNPIRGNIEWRKCS